MYVNGRIFKNTHGLKHIGIGLQRKIGYFCDIHFKVITGIMTGNVIGQDTC